MVEKDILVFSDLVREAQTSMETMNYFKIYKFLEENKCEIKHYQDYFFMVDSSLPKKSDNIRMLMAKIKVRISKRYE